MHDFKIPELGEVAPYGVYDIADNQGWGSVGIDADTGSFAVESIRRWWDRLCRARYPNATRLTITADCGGSNGPRVRLWKRELQRFANETGLKMTVAHLPTATGAQEQAPRNRLGPPRVADPAWTSAILGRILGLHGCPAPCGTRRRCRTCRLSAAPCLPSKSGRLSPRRPLGSSGARSPLGSTQRLSQPVRSAGHAWPALPAHDPGSDRAVYARILTAADTFWATQRPSQPRATQSGRFQP